MQRLFLRPPLRLTAALIAALVHGAAQAQAGAPVPKSPITIDAEQIEGISDVELNARGSVELKREDMTVFSERLKYNQELGRLEAEGGVRLQRSLERYYGPRLRYDTGTQTGEFDEPHFLIQTDLPSRGRADKLEFLGERHALFRNAWFTTCEPGNDDWWLEAEELELDYPSDEGRAKWPKLHFLDTTIAAFPSATFPLENKRRSGFLAPYYAQTSQRGFETGLPYYWNIAPERDATFTPVYMSKRGVQGKGELRYLDRSYNGELKLEYLPDDQAFDNRERWGGTFQHTQLLAAGLTGKVDYNRVSDDRYLVDFRSSVREVSQRNLNREGYLTYNMPVGGQTISMLGRVQSFQTLQDPQAPITPPYFRLPQLQFGYARNDIGGLMDALVPTEYVRFASQTLVEGDRVQLNPVLAAPALSPGWFFTPKLGAHYAAYALTNTAPGQPERQQVAVPWTSLDSGLVFERPASLFGAEMTQTLEPRLFYVYAPFRNQDQVPVFDTALADFNYAQLFSENRFVGGDRFGDADQFTLALTSRWLGTGGQEALRATVGQRYYMRNERVGLTPTSTLRTVDSSDYLASLGGRVTRTVTFDTTVQYDGREDRPNRLGAAVRYAPEIAKVLTVNYRFQRDVLKQIDVSGQWPFAAGWYAVGRYNYSIQDSRLVDGVGGIEYNGGCWVFRVVLQRIQASTNVTSTSLLFQLEFNGVGQIGTDETVTLLRRQVPGYSVTNPADRTLAPPSLQRALPFSQIF